MRLIVIPSDADPEELPELPDEFTQLILSMPASESVLSWALEQAAPVVIVSTATKDISEEVLEEIAEVIETPDPDTYCASLAERGDLAMLAWADTPERHRQLRMLTSQDVPVLDIADDFQELVLDDTPDIDDIVARVTAEVLKTVRAEIQEMLRSRRFRSAANKV